MQKITLWPSMPSMKNKWPVKQKRLGTTGIYSAAELRGPYNYFSDLYSEINKIFIAPHLANKRAPNNDTGPDWF